MILTLLSLGSLFGALLLTSCRTLPSGTFILLLLFGGVVLAVSQYCLRHKYQNKYLSAFCLSFILSFSWAYVQTLQRLAWQLPAAWQNKEIKLSGYIIDQAILDDNKARYTVEPFYINGEKLHNKHLKIQLYWMHPTAKLSPGNQIEATVKLKALRGLYNPGASDEEKYWFLEGLKARGKIVSLEAVKEGDFSLTVFRQAIANRLHQLFPDEEFLPVITALTIGIRSGLDPKSRDIFQKTGTSHLLAISGLHLGLVAAFCFLFIKRLACVFPRLLLRFPAPCIAAVVTLGFSFLYALLAGFSLPTQRAFIMISVAMLSILLKRKIFSWQAFLFALLLVILHDPLCVLQAGFWLSFCAVAALLMAKESLPEKSWRKWWQPQWVAFVGLLPLTVLFFNQVSLISPIANIFAIPIVAAVVVPISLLGVIFIYPIEILGEFLIRIAVICFSVVWQLLDFLSHIPFAAVSLAGLSSGIIFLSIIGTLLLLSPKGMPGKPLAILFYMPLLFVKPHIPYEQARISILDVGQGLSTVIETQNHVMLFDTGPQYGQYTNAGSKVILPYLHARKIQHIDKVLISHHDLDHRGGLSSLLDFPITEIQSSEPELLQGTVSTWLSVCQRDQSWQWDGVLFEILHPYGPEQKRNDRSCVLKITANQQSILIPGDITQQVEQKLVHHAKAKLKSDILIVPHHGSLTSSSAAFIDAVSPLYAVFAVGYGNHYGFPKADVLQRYERVGSENLLTYDSGTIIFDLGKAQKLTPPMKWRETAKRNWH